MSQEPKTGATADAPAIPGAKARLTDESWEGKVCWAGSYWIVVGMFTLLLN